MTNAAGCDSIVTLNLTINNSNTGTDTQTACDTYTWIDGNTYTSSTSTPTFTLVNAAGCDSIVTLNLTINTISASSIITDASCGASDGIIDLTVSGGVTPYIFLWSDASANEDLTNVIAGTYDITITDSNSCTFTSSYQILNLGSITIDITSSTNVLCNGSSTGLVDISVSGGATPYSFIWSNFEITEDLSGLLAGIYSVTVTDNNSCQAISTVTISEPLAVDVTSIITDASCGSSDGAVDITVTGGVSPYSFLWSNASTSEDLTAVSAGIYYITVTDVNACANTFSFTINNTGAPTIDVTNVVNVLCIGSADGSIDITVSGGVTPFTYTWSNSETTEDISGLFAGVYDVTVTDSNSCQSSTSITVTEPAIILVNETITNISCSTGLLGSIELTVSGGVSPYQFAWSNGATTSFISDLSVGAFSYTVTDANLCTSTNFVNIISEPYAKITGVAQSTFGFIGAGDAIVYLYNANDPGFNYVSQSDIAQNGTFELTNIPDGEYYLYVKLNNHLPANNYDKIHNTYYDSTYNWMSANVISLNCGDSVNFDINMYEITPPALGSGTLAGNVTYRSNNRSINGEPIPGAEITLEQEPDDEPIANVSTDLDGNYSFNNLADGIYRLYVDIPGYNQYRTYTVTVNEQNLSFDTLNFYVDTIVADRGIYIDTTSVIYATINANDITCNGLSNGTIDLEINGGTSPFTYLWSNGETTEDLSNLSAGTYNVTFTDYYGFTEFNSIVINEPSPVSVTETSLDATCNLNDGSIDISVSGGISPFSFIWSNDSTTQDISSLYAGLYSVSILDYNNCELIKFISVNNINAPIIDTAIIINNFCFGNSSGTIDLAVSGGTMPYTFNWSTEDFTEDITNLLSGFYFVTISDDLSCNTIGIYEITEPDSLTLTFNYSDILCNGLNDGSANVLVSGGTSPYNFVWSNSSTNDSITDIVAGTYSLTVSDVYSCKVQGSVVISEPSALSIGIISSQYICIGATNGNSIATVIGGTSPYNYLWSNDSIQNSINNLSEGTYYLTVTDANNCNLIDSTLIISENPITAVNTISDITCYGLTNGSISVVVNGGINPFSYLWSYNNLTSTTLNNLTSGTYFLTITDSLGCTKVDTAVVYQPNQITINSTINNVNCYGEANGSIDISVSGGVTPFDYLWNSGDTIEDISGLSANNYTIAITDAKNCTKSQSFTINQPIMPIILNADLSHNTCSNDSVGEINLTVFGGNNNYTFLWSNDSTSEDLLKLTGGKYSVTVTDNKGCSESDEYSINSSNELNITSYVENASCASSADGSISVSFENGTAPYMSEWSNGSNTEHLSNLSEGVYTITVTDANLCTALRIITVETNNFYCVEVFNAFSPNKDGVNDVWNIKGIENYPECNVDIYNQWGKNIFSSKGYVVPWDGLFNDKELPSDSYYYIIKLGKEEKPLTGSVSIIK